MDLINCTTATVKVKQVEKIMKILKPAEFKVLFYLSLPNSSRDIKRMAEDLGTSSDYILMIIGHLKEYGILTDDLENRYNFFECKNIKQNKIKFSVSKRFNA